MKSQRLRLFVYTFLLITTPYLFAQPQGARSGNSPKIGVISGKISDLVSGTPIEYASVSIYRMRDSILISGSITNAQGEFSIPALPYGKYKLDADFIGFKKTRINGIEIKPGKNEVFVGDIKLEQVTEEIEGVEITADKLSMEYKLDKKVINVSQDLISASQTAVDILENSPSIQTDIEGNVSLRGSSSFTVLIDGKPSALGGNDALQTMPASSIDKIEIITNPSVKYDPEGIGGIINVITKKGSKGGLTGIVNLKAGTEPSYGGDILLNYRKNKINVFTNLEYGVGKRPGSMVKEDAFYYLDGNTGERLLDTIYYTDLKAVMNRYRNSSRVKAGIDYYLNQQHTISWFAAYTVREFGREGNSDEHEYDNLDIENSYFNNVSSFDLQKKAVSTNLSHLYKSKNKKHSLNSYLDFSMEDGLDVNETSRKSTLGDYSTILENVSRSLAEEQEDETEFEFKSEYVFNINEKNKFEAGIEIDLDNEVTKYISTRDTFGVDSLGTSDWFMEEERNTDLKFKKHIYGAYMMYAGTIATIDYQLGLRVELTDREINQRNIDSVNALYRIDPFPSVHLSKKLPFNQELMTSYSNRIHRPRGHHLTPYSYYYNDKNIRVGNPQLEPEYIHSFELNYQKKFKQSFFSAETYYRYTDNKMERVKEIFDEEEQIMLHKYQNIGSDQSIGLELMLNVSPVKWWTIIATGNVYNYKINGDLTDEGTTSVTNTWSSRLNSTIKLKTGTRIQVMGMYRGPSITVQGNRDAMYFVNLGVRQDFFKRQLSVNLSVRDVFNTMGFSFTSGSESFSSYQEFDMKSPQINFAITYRINNYKPEKGRNGTNEYDFNGGEGGM